jgi:hypothetical protein
VGFPESDEKILANRYAIHQKVRRRLKKMPEGLPNLIMSIVPIHVTDSRFAQ